MVSEDKGTSSKKLYSFIKSKKCDGSGVAPLKKDGKTYTDASEKAELLNEQFSSVFCPFPVMFERLGSVMVL
jgi:hypothetical protein